MDALQYTYDTIYEQLALLELHMKDAQHPEMDKWFCQECAIKHIKSLSGLAKEGLGFSDEEMDVSYFKELLAKTSEWLEDLKAERWRKIAHEARMLRKKLLECETCEEPEPEDIKAYYEAEKEIEAGKLKSLNNPHNPIPEYCHFTPEVINPKEMFDPRSFRTLCPECPEARCSLCPPELRCATRIIVGCPKPYWDEEKGVCRVGMKAHVIYHGKPKIK